MFRKGRTIARILYQSRISTVLQGNYYRKYRLSGVLLLNMIPKTSELVEAGLVPEPSVLISDVPTYQRSAVVL